MSSDAVTDWVLPGTMTWPASNWNSLDLGERDLVVGAIVVLGRARPFVRGHGLRPFQRAADLELGGELSRAELVATELYLEAGFGRPPTDHPAGVDGFLDLSISTPVLLTAERKRAV